MDAPAIGMRFWLIKALNAADLAEQMFRFAASKTVARQLILTGQKRKAFVRDKQMQIARSRTDRAIAIEHIGARIAQRLKPDSAAMAAAGDGHELAHSTGTDFARLRG